MASFISLLSAIVSDEGGEYDGDVDEVLSRNLEQSSKVIGAGGSAIDDDVRDDVGDDKGDDVDVDELELASSSGSSWMSSMNNRRGTIAAGVVVSV